MALFAGGLWRSVRYRSDVTPLRTTLCHGAMARHVSGSIAQGWVTVPYHCFQFTAQAPAEYRSSDPVVRPFCSNCPSPLTDGPSGCPDELAVTGGSLDQPEQAPANVHRWMAVAIAGDKPTDGLPQYAGDRT